MYPLLAVAPLNTGSNYMHYLVNGKN